MDIRGKSIQVEMGHPKRRKVVLGVVGNGSLELHDYPVVIVRLSYGGMDDILRKEYPRTEVERALQTGQPIKWD